MYIPEPQHGPQWSRIMAVLGNAIEHWTEFDGWALSQGFDPLEVPSRRLVAAAWMFIIKDLDFEVRDKLVADLFSESYEEVKKKEEKKEPNVITAPKDKWRAPKGWKPPGWSDEAAYQSGISFMANKPG